MRFGINRVILSHDTGGGGKNTGQTDPPGNTGQQPPNSGSSSTPPANNDSQQQTEDPPADDDPAKGGDKPKKPVFTPEQQEAINEMMGRAREEGRTAAKTEIERQQEDARREAERQQAIKDGDLQKQIDLTVKERDDAIKERDQAIADLATERDTNLRLRIAAKHKLPEGWHTRLQGKTEAELDADAAIVAKTVSTPRAPKTEGGPKDDIKPEELEQKNREIAESSGRYSL